MNTFLVGLIIFSLVAIAFLVVALAAYILWLGVMYKKSDGYGGS